MVEKKRIEWIDLAKGFSIILVVYGHSGLSSVPFLGPWFACFRMPFFFLCSGLLFKSNKYPTLASFVKRRWKTLIRPYFFFSAVVLALEAIIQSDFGLFVRNTIQYGWGGYALWFIPVLILTELYYYCMCKISCGEKWIIIGLLLVSAFLGFISSKYNWPNNYNLCFVLTSVLFYGLGNILGQSLITFFDSARIRTIILVGVMMFVLSMTFVLSKEKSEFFINYLVDGYTYTSAIGGALFMCVVSCLICRLKNRFVQIFKDAVKFFGRNSYVVLAFHQIILLLLGHFFNLPGVVSRFIMWSTLVLIIYIINSYIPEILGREKK